MTKRALIFGVSGQDGAYLANFLLNKGYHVIGTSRDAQLSTFQGLKVLGIQDEVETISSALTDFQSVLTAIRRSNPCEIYNLAGQSSVGLSFDQPAETIESILIGTLNILEAVRLQSNSEIHFYSAGSSECFGDTGNAPATEETHFNPRSPYAVAKASAHYLVKNYREAYDLFACTGMLFNHESPLRPSRFVTKKIVESAINIAQGSGTHLSLGNIDIERDWGWAPEYVEAMWMMLQTDQPEDFVIATGRTVSLRYFIEMVFQYYNLDYRMYVTSDSNLLRPSDIFSSRADPRKSKSCLGWSSKMTVEDIIIRLCQDSERDGPGKLDNVFRDNLA